MRSSAARSFQASSAYRREPLAGFRAAGAIRETAETATEHHSAMIIVGYTQSMLGAVYLRGSPTGVVAAQDLLIILCADGSLECAK